jgi:hypothetical protein
MSGEQSNDNKWKNHLLKSSLPHEQIVSEKLQGSDFYLVGKYPYIRPNEQDINTEFSIDTQARLRVKAPYMATLLVECKYNYPGIRWVFSQYPKSKSSFMPGELYCLHDREQHQLHSLSTLLPICTQGIELYNNGFEPNTISHGLNQLFYGMPNLIIQEALNKNNKWSTGKATHSFICLLLVTTADLYILKPEQSLDNYHSATSLDDVASKVDALIVAQEEGPHLHQYCESLLRMYIKRSTDERDKVKKIPNLLIEDFSRKILPSILSVIIVNLDSFEYILEKIKNTINDIFQKNDSLKKK